MNALKRARQLFGSGLLTVTALSLVWECWYGHPGNFPRMILLHGSVAAIALIFLEWVDVLFGELMILAALFPRLISGTPVGFGQKIVLALAGAWVALCLYDHFNAKRIERRKARAREVLLQPSAQVVDSFGGLAQAMAYPLKQSEPRRSFRDEEFDDVRSL